MNLFESIKKLETLAQDGAKFSISVESGAIWTTTLTDPLGQTYVGTGVSMLMSIRNMLLLMGEL